MTCDPAPTGKDKLERAFVATLRLAGACEVLAVFAAIMPADWMRATHHALRLGAHPDLPLFGYLARSASLMWAMHGALVWFLASDVRRFLPVLHFNAWLTLLLGFALLGIDIVEHMPTWWIASEGTIVIVTGAWFLYAARRVAKSQRDG